MTSKGRKIRIGLFVIITATLIGIVLVTFAGVRFWERRDRYHIVYHGTVLGLESGALVYFNGAQVGTVQDIAVSKTNVGDVVVTIAVDAGTPIHVDTRAVLELAGITGLKVVDLRDTSATSPRLPPGGEIEPGKALLDRIGDNAEKLVEQSAQLMERANHVVGELEGIDEVVREARVTARNLAAASGTLKTMVGENRDQLRSSLAAIEKTANRASSILDQDLSRLLTDADSLVTDVRGVVRRNDTALRTAMFDLQQASRSFKELARELREKPSLLLYSKAQPERKLP